MNETDKLNISSYNQRSNLYEVKVDFIKGLIGEKKWSNLSEEEKQNAVNLLPNHPITGGGNYRYIGKSTDVSILNAISKKSPKGQQVSGGKPAIEGDTNHPKTVEQRIEQNRNLDWNAIPKVAKKQPVVLKDGSIAYQDINLHATLERIRTNKPNKELGEGKIFHNDPSRGFKIPGSNHRTTYKEWTVEVPNSKDRGTHRLVVGSDNSIWYTSNHYGELKGKDGKPIGITWVKIK